MSYNRTADGVPLLELNASSSNNRQCEFGADRTNDEPSLLHCHDLRPVYSNETAWKKLVAASSLCFIFAVGEVIGGVYADSLAIMTDAAHMFSDFGTFCISMLAIWIAKRRADHKRTFGFYRAEIIGAFLSVLIIWFVTGVLVYMAAHRIRKREFNIKANTMIFTASFGVAVNLILGCVLHGFGMKHSHTVSSSNEENINVRAAFIHVVGDTVQSVGVLIAALIIKYKPNWGIADPICTFIFSFLVLLTTVNILRDALHILCEGVPRSLDYFEVKSLLCKIPGVKMVHSLHLWSLNVDKVCLTAHLATDLNVDSYEVLQMALRKLKQEFQIFHITIQVEAYQPSIMSSCADCLTPSVKTAA